MSTYWNSTIKVKPKKKKKRIIYRNLITDNTYKGKFTKFGKPKVLPLNKLETKADEVFAKWIRERDRHRGCYANEIPEERGKCKNGYHCCHLFGRAKRDIRFDEFNCNGGCGYHNQIHDHTMRPQPHIYTGWFIKKYGVDKYEELRKRSYIVRKFTRDELLAIIQKYKLD